MQLRPASSREGPPSVGGYAPPPPDMLCLYTTSLRAVRKTQKDSDTVRSMLDTLCFEFVERDVSMARQYQAELKARNGIGRSPLTPSGNPRVLDSRGCATLPLRRCSSCSTAAAAPSLQPALLRDHWLSPCPTSDLRSEAMQADGMISGCCSQARTPEGSAPAVPSLWYGEACIGDFAALLGLSEDGKLEVALENLGAKCAC